MTVNRWLWDDLIEVLEFQATRTIRGVPTLPPGLAYVLHAETTKISLSEADDFLPLPVCKTAVPVGAMAFPCKCGRIVWKR